MAQIDSRKHRHQSSNGGRSIHDDSPSLPGSLAAATAVAPQNERVATVLPTSLPPDEELSEEERRYRKELDDVIATRTAERRDAWRELLGPLMRAEDVLDLVGLASLEELDELVKQWRVLALPTRQGGVVYPAFQFSTDGQPYPAIAEIIEVFAPVAETPYTIASWLMSPKPYFDDRSPIQWLKSGRSARHVVNEARLAADHMAHF